MAEALAGTEEGGDKAQVDQLANTFRSIIGGKEGDERAHYLTIVFSMLSHEVQKLEKRANWAERSIDQLESRQNSI